MEIAVSSIAYLGKPVEEFVSSCEKNEFVPEFSSGMPYRPDMEEIFLRSPFKKKYTHNYFPAPEFPFVLNLASADKDIRKKSIEHCIKGMQLSERAGAPFFSAHAGFCIDPKPDELGQQLTKAKNLNRASHWPIFIDSVWEVLKRTKETGLGFLVENNVLAKMNLYEDGTNPLLCVESWEMQKFIKDINDQRAGLLLDTAHVKVSALTLGFDQKKLFEELASYVKCVHHSDNEGEFDNNMSITTDYWFLPLMENFKKCLHVVEVKKINETEIERQIELLKNTAK